MTSEKRVEAAVRLLVGEAEWIAANAPGKVVTAGQALGLVVGAFAWVLGRPEAGPFQAYLDVCERISRGREDPQQN